MNTTTIKMPASIRISRTATICLEAGIDKVFPLFGPIREREWAFGWNPEVLYSESLLVEEKMIFRTQGTDGHYIWTVSRYDEDLHLVEYTVHTENRLWFIIVQCLEESSHTKATITYTFNSLTDAGIALNQNALDEMFRHDLKDWEEAINHYILHGHLLQPKQASLT